MEVIGKDIPPSVGMRVARGPDWDWGNQDQHCVGTIVEVQLDGWVMVRWDHGGGPPGGYAYRAGRSGQYDLIMMSRGEEPIKRIEVSVFSALVNIPPSKKSRYRKILRELKNG